MPEDQTFPTLPPDVTPSWLARNRKIAILVGVVIVLMGGVALVLQVRRPSNTANTTSNQTNTGANTVTGQERTTFQRSTITNTSTTLPQTYRPPTTEQLRQAITNLNSPTNSKP